MDWKGTTSKKQRQVGIDSVRKNDKWVSHDYTVGNLLYVDMNDIYI